MRVTTQPTEPIFRDAWAIADAIAYQQDQEARMRKAIQREGLMSSKASKLSEDIVRLQVLIQERTKNWVANYGTDTTWTQYLDGNRHAAKVAA